MIRLDAFRSRAHRLFGLLGVLGVVAALAGCTTAAPPPSAVVELPFEQAAMQASNGLMAQARELPAFKPRSGRHTGTVLDPVLDASTGQQTAATVQLGNRVVEQLAARLDGVELLPFKAASLASAQYLLTGTLTRTLADRPKGSMLINLALTELKTGKVAAQSWALAHDDGLDHSPLPYYADSPVLVRDKAIEGYVTTSATAAGMPADRYYLDRLRAAAWIDEANQLYNSEKYQEALIRYRAAANETGGDQLRVLDGIYLTSVKLGKSADAERSFAKIVAYGLANNQLGVKFLFNPDSTVFWSDPKVSGSYPMWLREIARESTAAKACMSIVGHTSRTGSEAANDALSLQRANFIRQRLIGEASVLAGRTKSRGMGYRQNIVGSGNDNAVDALDRRVEFKIVPCG